MYIFFEQLGEIVSGLAIALTFNIPAQIVSGLINIIFGIFQIIFIFYLLMVESNNYGTIYYLTIGNWAGFMLGVIVILGINHIVQALKYSFLCVHKENVARAVKYVAPSINSSP